MGMMGDRTGKNAVATLAAVTAAASLGAEQANKGLEAEFLPDARQNLVVSIQAPVAHGVISLGTDPEPFQGPAQDATAFFVVQSAQSVLTGERSPGNTGVNYLVKATDIPQVCLSMGGKTYSLSSSLPEPEEATQAAT